MKLSEGQVKEWSKVYQTQAEDLTFFDLENSAQYAQLNADILLEEYSKQINVKIDRYLRQDDLAEALRMVDDMFLSVHKALAYRKLIIIAEKIENCNDAIALFNTIRHNHYSGF